LKYLLLSGVFIALVGLAVTIRLRRARARRWRMSRVFVTRLGQSRGKNFGRGNDTPLRRSVNLSRSVELGKKEEKNSWESSHLDVIESFSIYNHG
jgi:hypothetical protein